MTFMDDRQRRREQREGVATAYFYGAQSWQQRLRKILRQPDGDFLPAFIDLYSEQALSDRGVDPETGATEMGLATLKAMNALLAELREVRRLLDTTTAETTTEG
jgi:hypothetical protein